MELIEVDRQQDLPIVVPTVARLDASVAPAFRQAVVRLVEGGDKRLVLDLSRVSFLDSSGLGALVSMLKAIGTGGHVVVCNAQAGVMSLFKLTRMDKVFPIVAGREEALARLRG